ncbi:hypothetical protein [Spirillospora sp. CA-128828]|uniref:hypothetical protein n=1 Tax=Spirillospora sp. CA-128828 TaxID=3240033 RepID=UPI003D943446
MMHFARRPIDTEKVAIIALGVVSVALAGVVIAKVCAAIVDDGSSSADELVVKLVVALLICAAVGAMISAVRGVIVRAVLGYRFGFLDLVVAAVTGVVGAVIGGLIGSAHDIVLDHDAGILFGGLIGFLAGLFVAIGSLAVSRGE